MKAYIAMSGGVDSSVSALLMIFQSLAAPLPAFFITLTNANLFGWWQGCILSWASSMAGAALCFWIARILGRDVVEKICDKIAIIRKGKIRAAASVKELEARNMDLEQFYLDTIYADEDAPLVSINGDDILGIGEGN